MRVARLAVVSLAYRAHVELPSAPAWWTLTAPVAGTAVASRAIRVVDHTGRHPYAIVVDPRGRVFVSDDAARRIVLVSPVTRGRSLHATGFEEPVGLSAWSTRRSASRRWRRSPR